MEAISFSGPDGTAGSFYTYNGERISSSLNGSRWIQYRAYLTTENIHSTPSLASVRIKYNLLHEIIITSPLGGENWTGVQNITWSANDKDNDALSFNIYIENESTNVLLANNLASNNRQWSWDIDSIMNGTYWIRILARDDNPSIPLSVNATSGNFTIYHPPPPNHPPHIALISPPDKSFRPTPTAHLLWLGTDPDSDPLTYTVQYSDHPLDKGPSINVTTTSEFLDLTNLADNTTYYWTVSASDGKSNGTDVPTEVWSFTVRLPPANIPVRFTSTPDTTAWVGKEYTYNLTSIDEDGDLPSYALVSAPSSMTLDSSTGKLHWTPTTSDIGNHTITIRVSDGRGSTDNQTFTITVKEIPAPPVIPPKCAITYPANGTKVNGTINVLGTASNGSLPLSAIKIRLDNGTWSTAIGLGNWNFTLNTAKLAKGPHRIEAKAFAANLSSETASVDFTVSNPAPGTSVGDNQWCLPAVLVAIVVGICTLILVRKRKR
jgi:hypothetical protein